VTTLQKTANRDQNTAADTSNGATGDDSSAAIVTTGDDTGLVGHLKAENIFLREQIAAWRLQAEAANRTAAETAAALRKALDAMPKALSNGSTALSGSASPEKAPDATQSSPNDGMPKRSPQRGKEARKLAPWQHVVARILGIR
jgi:hypothetical protein